METYAVECDIPLLLLLLARQFSPLYPRDELAFSENFPFVDGTVWVV